MDSRRIRFHLTGARQRSYPQLLVGPHRPVPACRIVRILPPKAIARQSGGPEAPREKSIAREPPQVFDVAGFRDGAFRFEQGGVTDTLAQTGRHGDGHDAGRLPQLRQTRLELLRIEAFPEPGQPRIESLPVRVREIGQHLQGLFLCAALEQQASHSDARGGTRLQVAPEFLFGLRRVAVTDQDETVGGMRTLGRSRFQRQQGAVGMNRRGQTALLRTRAGGELGNVHGLAKGTCQLRSGRFRQTKIREPQAVPRLAIAGSQHECPPIPSFGLLGLPQRMERTPQSQRRLRIVRLEFLGCQQVRSRFRRTV